MSNVDVGLLLLVLVVGVCCVCVCDHLDMCRGLALKISK